MNERRERERDYTIYKRIDIELDNDWLIQLIMYRKWCVRGPTMQRIVLIPTDAIGSTRSL